MSTNPKAFLKIEKLTESKIEGYSDFGEIPLSNKTMYIGRSGKQNKSNDPDIRIIGDHYISRLQARIDYNAKDDCFHICDVGSLNGTYINGQLLEHNKQYRLKDYDVIGLAKVSGEMRANFRFVQTTEQTLPSWIAHDDRKASRKTGLCINIASRRVFVDNTEITLTGREFKVIEFLYNNRNLACSTDDISWEVWGKEGASDELVAKYISLIRRKIEKDPSHPRFLITVPGRQSCYRLEL